jgi:hypothetical protein
MIKLKRKKNFKGKLTPSTELPKFVSEFKPVQGERLAANSTGHSVPRLVGAVQALASIDLNKYNLGQYKTQVAISGTVDRLTTIMEDNHVQSQIQSQTFTQQQQVGNEYMYTESKDLYGSVGQNFSTKASPAFGNSFQGSSANLYASAAYSSASSSNLQQNSLQNASSGSSNFIYGSF